MRLNSRYSLVWWWGAEDIINGQESEPRGAKTDATISDQRRKYREHNASHHSNRSSQQTSDHGICRTYRYIGEGASTQHPEWPGFEALDDRRTLLWRRQRIYRLAAPTLLVWGREDKLMPPVYAERWQQLVPGAELHVLDEAGHMVPYEQTTSVAEKIEAFLG